MQPAVDADLVAGCGDLADQAGGAVCLAAEQEDLFSRRLLGYAIGARHDADPVVAALHMAAATRGGHVRGVIFHSDRGGGVRLAEVPPDLPHTGSFPVHRPGRTTLRLPSARLNSVLKVEYVHRYTFATRPEARIRIATRISDWLHRKVSTKQNQGIDTAFRRGQRRVLHSSPAGTTQLTARGLMVEGSG